MHYSVVLEIIVFCCPVMIFCLLFFLVRDLHSVVMERILKYSRPCKLMSMMEK